MDPAGQAVAHLLPPPLELLALFDIGSSRIEDAYAQAVNLALRFQKPILLCIYEPGLGYRRDPSREWKAIAWLGVAQGRSPGDGPLATDSATVCF